MESKKEITLGFPVEGAAGRVERLTLRRGKVRDQIAAQAGGGSPAEQEVRLVGFLTGQPPELIELLDLGDYALVQEALTGFLRPPVKPAPGSAGA